MSHKVGRIFLAIFMFAHLALAVGFALKTPYRQAGSLFSQRAPSGGFQQAPDIGAPDERQHANYIGYLIREGKLPVFDPKSPTLGEDYQSHQPPGFYLAAKVVAQVTGESSPDSQGFGRNIRFLNGLFGVLAIAGTFFGALWGTKKVEVAVIAASFQSLLPMNIALSGAVSNDPLLIAIFCWGTALLFKLAARDEDSVVSVKAVVGTAILCGLAVYVKMSGLILVAGGIATLGFLASKRQIEPKKALLGIVIIGLMTLPILLRNQSLYGDMTAQKAFKEAFVNSPKKEHILGTISASGAPGSPEVQYWVNWIGYWTARSFVGVFGYMDIWLNESGRVNTNSPNLLYKAVIGFNFAGVIAFALYMRSKVQDNRRVLGIAVGLVALTIALFIAFTNIYFQAQARYLFPAIASISLLLTLGWLHLFKQKWQLLLGVVVLVFGGLSVYSLSQLPQEFEARISGTLPIRTP